MSNNNPPPAPDYLPPAVPDSEALKAKYAEIAALKRAIEEKKMNQYSHSPVPSWYGGRGGFRGAFRGGFRGSTRGGVRAGYGRGNVHRNMTLVFEPTAANSSTANEPNTNNNNINNNNSEVAYISTTNTGSMSLINSSIYEQESKARQQNFEAALNSKEALRISNLEKGFQRKIQIRKAKTENFDRVRINKEIFAVTHGGMTLVLIGSSQGGLYDEDQKVVYWNNLPYIRIENGDLMCHVNRGRVKSPVDCSFFGSTGYCQKGSTCPFQHDPNLIRLCRSSINKVTCVDQSCLLSHKRNQYNTPLCKYFLENKCTMTQCPFLHHKPEHYDDANVEIWTCRPFAIGGYCKRGSRCPFLHLYTCPNFEEDGTCPRRTTCKLSHTITESTQTRILNRKEIEEDEDVLVESDEEDEKRSEKKVEKRIVNSYTVNPDSLFDKGIEDKYSYYIDSKPDSPAIPSTNLHTFQDNNEFMIHLDSSDSENDDLEDNNDYVLIDLEPDIIEHNNEAELKNGERNEIKGVKEKQPEEPIEEESKEVEPKEEEPKEEEPKENCEKEELEY